MRLKQLLASILFVSSAIPAFASETDSLPPVDYTPKIGGVMRACWEMLTESGDNKFALRNARVNLKGNIARPVSYYVQWDLCDNGKLKFLDGWAKLALLESLKIKAGQFRVPFGVDPFRGPANYIFANRSFIGREIANNRAVGISVSYTLPVAPLKLEAGVFNPNGISDHTVWNRSKLYAAKATLEVDDFSISGGFQSTIPDGIRINMADASLRFSRDRWLAEAEYMYKHYTGSTFDNCHAYVAFVSYAMPVKLGIFRTLSVQARADGSTPHSTGVRDDTGKLAALTPHRNRITAGSTITYTFKRLRCDFRVNFEKYFYHHDASERHELAGDRLTAEAVIVF